MDNRITPVRKKPQPVRKILMYRGRNCPVTELLLATVDACDVLESEMGMEIPVGRSLLSALVKKALKDSNTTSSATAEQHITTVGRVLEVTLKNINADNMLEYLNEVPLFTHFIPTIRNKCPHVAGATLEEKIKARRKVVFNVVYFELRQAIRFTVENAKQELSLIANSIRDEITKPPSVVDIIKYGDSLDE